MSHHPSTFRPGQCAEVWSDRCAHGSCRNLHGYCDPCAQQHGGNRRRVGRDLGCSALSRVVALLVISPSRTTDLDVPHRMRIGNCRFLHRASGPKQATNGDFSAFVGHHGRLVGDSCRFVMSQLAADGFCSQDGST